MTDEWLRCASLLAQPDASQRQLAENWLNDLVAAPDAVSRCCAALQQANSPDAALLAAVTLRRAVPRAVPSMDASAVLSLFSWLCDAAAAPSSCPSVRRPLASVAVLLLPCALVQSHDHPIAETMLQRLSTESIATVSVFVDELIAVWSRKRRGVILRVPVAQFLAARRIFQLRYLQPIWQLAYACLLRQRSAPADDLAAAASVLTGILESDLALPDNVNIAQSTQLIRARRDIGSLAVSPDLAALLASPDWQDAPAVAAAMRALLIALCSLAGPMFGRSSDERRAARGNWLHALLPAITSQLRGVNRDVAWVADAATLVHRVASNWKPAELMAVQPDVRKGLLDAMAAATAHLVDAMPVSIEDHASLAVEEAADRMLAAWALLADDGAATPASLEVLTPYTSAVFQRYVQSQLARAAAQAQLEEDEIDDATRTADRLATVGAIARLDPASSSALLCSLAQQTGTDWDAAAAAAALDPATLATLHERMDWLVRWLTNVLTYPVDDAGSETPMIPELLHRASLAAPSAEQDPAVAMLHALLHATQLEDRLLLQSPGAWSPRVGAAIAAAWARFSRVYLLLDEALYDSLSPRLVAMLGKDSDHATQLMLQLVAKALSNLSNAPHELDAASSSADLLCGLLHRRELAALLLRNAPASLFDQLAAMLDPTHLLPRLPPRVRPVLAEAVVRIAAGTRDPAVRARVLAAPCAVVDAFVAALSSVQAGDQLKHSAGALEQANLALDVLCGIARAADAIICSDTFALCQRAMPLLPGLLAHGIDAHADNLVDLVLAFLTTLTQRQLAYLAPRQAVVVLQLCMRVIELLDRLLAIPASATYASDDMARVERRVRAVLHVLDGVLSKAMLDFAEADATAGDVDIDVSVRQVLHRGAAALIPVLFACPALLQVPECARPFYDLLQFLLGDDSTEVSTSFALPGDAVTLVLQHGIGADDEHVALAAKRATTGVGRAIASARRKQQASLPFAGVDIAALLRALFALLMRADTSASTLEAEADAWYALVFAAPDAFRAFVQHILSGCGTVAFADAAAVQTCFDALIVAPQGTAELVFQPLSMRREYTKRIQQFVREISHVAALTTR